MADAKVKEVLAKLEVLGNERVREQNVKRGAGDLPQFGVRLGEIRKVAKEVRADHDLGLELWETGDTASRLVALLVELGAHVPTRALTLTESQELVRDTMVSFAKDRLRPLARGACRGTGLAAVPGHGDPAGRTRLVRTEDPRPSAG